MKKSLVALAALVATGAFAQASITGQVRLGIASNASGVTSVSDGQTSGNEIRIGTSEDLGGGLKFDSRADLRVDENGAIANSNNLTRYFAGISGAFGNIQVGRINLNQMWGYSPFGSTDAHTNPEGVAGATENGQIRYTTPSFNGFKAELASTKSANTSAATTDGSAVLLSYANGPLSVATVQETKTDGTKGRAIGASYNAGVATIMLISAVDKNAAGATSAQGTSLGLSMPMGAYTFKVAMKNDTTSTNNDKRAIGVDYALSKTTKLSADTWKSSNDANSSYWIGVTKSF